MDKAEIKALLAITGKPSPGETVHTNHTACGDTRGRAYLTGRPPLILAYCQNCAAGGVLRESGPPNIKVASSVVSTTSPKDVLPADYESGHPIAAKYMAQYGFDPIGTVAFGAVGWSEDYQRIVLPVQDGPSGAVKGCQLRRVGDYGPKYITMRPTAEPLECVWKRASSITVITEDLLSAWRVWEAGYTAVPLLGAHVRPERLAKMIGDGHREWIVWLDNDKPEIDDAARYMQNLIRALGAKACRVTIQAEPKEYTIGQVERQIAKAV